MLISILMTLLLAEFAFDMFEKFKSAQSQTSTNQKQVSHAGDYAVGYWMKSDIGYHAKSGVHSAILRSSDGGIVYSVKYTIGNDGYRITPGNRKKERINFFGCSFTFGEGLNDNQTLPYYVAEKLNVSVKNYGFHGYGPHQALGILQSDRDTSGGMNLLLTLPWHAERSACIPSFSVGSPRYILEKGKLKRNGTCEEKKTNKAYAILNKSILVGRMKNVFYDRKKQDDQIELYLAIITEMAHLSKQRGQKFLVGFINADEKWFIGSFSNDLILNKIRSAGIQVVDLSLDDSEKKYYIHELDKHPSAIANEVRAGLIIDAIKNKERAILSDLQLHFLY